MSRAIEQERPTPRLALGRAGRFLWEAFWTPFWLGSTLPPPVLPGRRDPASPAGARTPMILRQLDELRAKIWRQRFGILVFRTIWLALLVLNLWLGFRVLAHRDLALRPFALVAVLTVAFGVALIALARPSRGQLARTLDRSYGLRERVATALEETQREQRLGGVRALQVLEATRVTRNVSRSGAFRRRLPLREIAMTIVMAAICVVLLVMLLINRGGGTVGAGNPPPGARAGGQSTGPQSGNGQQQSGQQGQNGQQGQTGQGQQGQGQQSGQNGQPSAQGQRDLDTLAGALQDHAATRQAADRLANGDNAGAAQALREAGQNAGQLSPQERQDLAGDLREAAGQVSDPKLAQDLKDLADKLTRPGATGAQGAFNQVANDVDRVGQGDQQGQGQNDQNGQQGQSGQQGQQGGAQPGGGTGSGSGASPQLPSQQQQQSTQGPATPLLGADGKPIELPKGNNNGPQINTQNPNNRGNGQTDPNAAGAGGGQLRQGTVGEAGVDPNQVPYDQRGTVQNYFTPKPDDNK